MKKIIRAILSVFVIGYTINAAALDEKVKEEICKLVNNSEWTQDTIGSKRADKKPGSLCVDKTTREPVSRLDWSTASVQYFEGKSEYSERLEKAKKNKILHSILKEQNKPENKKNEKNKEEICKLINNSEWAQDITGSVRADKKPGSLCVDKTTREPVSRLDWSTASVQYYEGKPEYAEKLKKSKKNRVLHSMREAQEKPEKHRARVEKGPKNKLGM